MAIEIISYIFDTKTILANSPDNLWLVFTRVEIIHYLISKNINLSYINWQSVDTAKVHELKYAFSGKEKNRILSSLRLTDTDTIGLRERANYIILGFGSVLQSIKPFFDFNIVVDIIRFGPRDYIGVWNPAHVTASVKESSNGLSLLNKYDMVLSAGWVVPFTLSDSEIIEINWAYAMIDIYIKHKVSYMIECIGYDKILFRSLKSLFQSHIENNNRRYLLYMRL